MNMTYLKDLIAAKFETIQKFSDAVGVSRASVSAWINGKSTPEDHRLFDIITILDLSEDETARLMNVPETTLVFRRVGLGPSEETIQNRSKDIANTFFKIDGSSYVVNSQFFPIGNQTTDHSAIADIIRGLLCLDKHEPVRLGDVLMELKKHNINVFFVPFHKIGITYSTSNNKEVAFTATNGDRRIIFSDTQRTLDQVCFDICHELAHIVLNHIDATEEQEKLCNWVARELIYPKKFFLDKKDAIEPFLNAEVTDWNTALSRAMELCREFDWSPMGLAIALKENGLIKGSSHEYKRLMKLNTLISNNKSLDELFFTSFKIEDFESLQIFFNNEIIKNKDFFKPFLELKDAASCGRLSPRKFAELLNIDSGDADELIRLWAKKQDEEDSPNVSRAEKR